MRHLRRLWERLWGLMPWNGTTVRLADFTVTAQVWNDEVVENLAFLEEVNYTEFTSNVAVASASEAAPTDVVSSGAIVYEAVPHLIEFYAHEVATSASSADHVTLNLWDATTDLGRIAKIVTPAAGANAAPVYVARRLTPTAASHTYKIRAHRTTANGTVLAGAGGVGVALPGFIRITRVPTSS